jgi:DNA helicase HerA-like ATPase
VSDPKSWKSIGTIVGDASTAEFTFILRSFKSRVGDVVAVPMELPNADYSGVHDIIAWGRITSIERFNPFFPYEAAQELASESIPLVDTVLSQSRDQLQSKVLVLGFTSAKTGDYLDLYPLTYPIPPAADVRYPPAEAIKNLLAGGMQGYTPLKIGTLIARGDVRVDIAAERIAARHMAIMAMTGGGKTVAARRVIREFVDLGYPLLILDPHGDYLGLWEKRQLFPKTEIKLFYPHIVMTQENQRIVDTLIAKMTAGLTPPQQELLNWLLTNIESREGQTVLDYIKVLIKVAENVSAKKGPKAGEELKVGSSTANVVRRSLRTIEQQLTHMEISNTRLRAVLKGFKFEALPDPEGRPEGIIRPRQVSILYLGGYDHLTQSSIVSIVMEALFAHRANLADRIAPFLTVVEEAHNFVPSAREGTDETPSLVTLRKVITEGRKFGVGLVLITQRPSRVDETILAQCNSFLVMRLVNPKDQSYVRSVMENLPESDARMLPGFGPGQGIVSGQAVRFPLLVKIDFDKDLVGTMTGDENFIKKANEWKPDAGAASRARAAQIAEKLSRKRSRTAPRN